MTLSAGPDMARLGRPITSSYSRRMLSLPLTPALRRVIELSQRNAQECHHDAVGPQHLLRAMLRSPGCHARDFIVGGIGNGLDLWDRYWPTGMRVPEPPARLSALARACIHYACASARLRCASVVTTSDLLRVLTTCEDSALSGFFRDCGLDADAVASLERRRDEFQHRIMRARLDHPVVNLAFPDLPLGKRGVLTAVSTHDGTIAGALLCAAAATPGKTLTTLDILRSIQTFDPVDHYPIAPVIEAAALAGAKEIGVYELTVAAEQVRVSRPVMAALIVAFRMRDAYSLRFVNCALSVAALIMIDGGLVRSGFVASNLRGLTTTVDHVYQITRMKLAGLRQFLSPLAARLRFWLSDVELASPMLADLDNEWWDVSDEDPLLVIDLLHVALTGERTLTAEEATAERQSRVREITGVLHDAVGRADSDSTAVTFHGFVARCLMLAWLIRGDVESSAAPVGVLASLAISDRHVAGLDRLRTRNASAPLDPPWPLPSAAEIYADVAILSRATTLLDVVRRVDALGVWPSDAYVMEYSRLFESYKGPRTPFAETGHVEMVLGHIAARGVEQVFADSLSPLAEARVTARHFMEAETPAVFSALLREDTARRGRDNTRDFLRRLNDAPAPLDVTEVKDDLRDLEIRCSQALGTEYESEYLAAYIACKLLIAEKIADTRAASYAVETALHAIQLLVLYRSQSGEAKVAHAHIVVAWARAAASLADRARDAVDSELLSLRLAVLTVGDYGKLAPVLLELMKCSLGTSTAWIAEALRCLGHGDQVPMGPAVQLGIRSQASRPGERDRLLGRTRLLSDAVADYQAQPDVEHLKRLELLTFAVCELPGVSPEGRASLLVRLCAGVLLCTGQPAAVRSAAERVSDYLESFAETLSEPLSGWEPFTAQWLKVAASASASRRLRAAMRILEIDARGYSRARSRLERAERAADMRLIAELAAVENVRKGAFNEAALLLEMTADLARKDRREKWSPPDPASSARPLNFGPSLGMTEDPYSLAFIGQADDPQPEPEWLMDRRREVIERGWPSKGSFLMVVPNKDGGALVFLRDGTWDGVMAPTLDNAAAQACLQYMLANHPIPGVVMEHLETKIPQSAAEFICQGDPVVLIPRSWTTLMPLHAVLAEITPLADSPLLTYATSVGSWQEAKATAPQQSWQPDHALLVSSPRPSTLASLPHAAWEATRLQQSVSDATALPADQATRRAILDGLARAPSIFHFAGHGTPGGMMAAYDMKISVDEVLLLVATAPRLAVLSACDTAVPTMGESLELLSLTASFADTGCPGVVGNLWPVDDLATALVMDAFYEELMANGWSNPARALQRSVAWLRVATRDQCANRLRRLRLAGSAVPADTALKLPQLPVPYGDSVFWAPFVFYGV
jgi:hypothetical protein